MRKFLKLTSLLSLFFCAAAAYADPLTFNFNFQGDSALVTGSITFESTLLANGGNQVHEYSTFGPELLDLTVNVSGGGQFDGTYYALDFNRIYWNPGGNLDFTRPLVGQVLLDGTTWGPNHNVGGFSFIADGPIGQAGPFSLQVGNTGTTLTALDPTPVPEPETYAMMLAGVGLLAVARRRKTALLA